MIPALDSEQLLISLVIGCVGLGLFAYGKRAQRVPHAVTGVLLMVYPYFTSTTTQMIEVGGIITLGLFAAMWLGW